MLDLSEGFFHAALAQCGRKWPFGASGETDQTMCVIFQLFFLDRAFAFFSAQLHLGNQPAEILIASAGDNEERKAEGVVIPSAARNPYPGHIVLRIGILRLILVTQACLEIAQDDVVEYFARDLCAYISF